MKKKVVYVTLLISLLAIILTSCNQFNIGVDKTEAVGEKSLIFDGPILIDNKPIQELTYADVLEHFGDPMETRVEEFRFPGAGPTDYNYFAVLCYKSIEILFYLLDDSLDSIKHTDNVWSFEITGIKYNIGELRVGMTVDEYLKKFGDSKKYLISELDEIKSDPYNVNESRELVNVLTIPRPENYYSEYEYVYYERGNYPYGFALLIKDNKIDRIVFGKR